MVVAEAIIFAPLLYIAAVEFPGVIQRAGVVTMLGFGGLTAIAFVTRKDFSFLRGILMWGGICALALMAALLLPQRVGRFKKAGVMTFSEKGPSPP